MGSANWFVDDDIGLHWLGVSESCVINPYDSRIKKGLEPNMYQTLEPSVKLSKSG